MNRFVDASADLVANLQVFGSEPATHALVLQICMQAMGQYIILAGVADENSVVLDRMHHGGAPEVDPLIRDTSFTQKVQSAAVLRKLDRVQFNVGPSPMHQLS